MALSNKGLVKKILALTQTIGTSWKDDLYELGLYHYVEKIYNSYEDDVVCNTIVAFVILSYSNESDWIVVDHTRERNKYDTLVRLGVPEKDLKKDFWNDIITRQNPIVNDFSSWFLSWQKDSRWSTFLSKKEYYSENISFVNTPLNPTKEVVFRGEITTIALSDEEMLKAKVAKGKLLTEAQEQEQSALLLHKEMEKDFVTLNAILNKEEIPDMTDKKQISWENVIYKKDASQQ